LEQSDYVICPHCGKTVVLARRNRLGRKPLNIGVKNIYDTLKTCCDISLAAQKLCCSRAYIYTELKKHGMTPREVIEKR